MNRIVDVFGTAPVLLPVIHPIGRDEALAAIHSVYGLGLKGIFLIDQGMTEPEVLTLAREVRDRYPSLWIGINLLSRTPADALTVIQTMAVPVDGIWSDNAGIDEHASPQTTFAHPQAKAFTFKRGSTHWNGLYFGGVAFKYQRKVAAADLGRAAGMAVPHMDVLCTSGLATGHPADVEKVRALREGLGDHSMALASGVTAENVRSYLPYVQAFLVGTGIEQRVGVLDPAKVEALLRAIDARS